MKKKQKKTSKIKDHKKKKNKIEIYKLSKK
jgi:hypothetical protein